MKHKLQQHPPLFSLLLLLLGLPSVCLSEEVPLYDNTHLEAKPPPWVPAGAPPPFYAPGDTHGAYQFFTWESNNVSSASVTLMRTGNPGGTIFYEIWDTDVNNLPDNKVGTLGSVPVEDIPTELGLVKVEGSVTGLQSMTRYYLVLRFGEDVNITGRSQTIHDAPLFPGDHSWAGPGTPHPPGGEPLHEVLWQENNDGIWHTFTDSVGAPPGAWQHMRIAAACPSYTLNIPTDHGTVTRDPEMPTYPAGTEVTLAATPNEGYEFTRWLIGEEELTDNPLTFTVEADATIRPEFTATAAGIVHYDTLDHSHSNAGRPNRATHTFLELPRDAGARDAQAFVTSGDNVTSVTIGMGRQGAPGEHLRFEIWEAAPSGNPSKSVGVLGEVEMDAVTNYPSWPGAPPYLEELTVNGMVSGLTPNTTYFLVIYYTVDNYIGPPFDWGYDAVDGPEEYEIGDIVVNPGNGWRRLATYFNPGFDYYLRAKIAGTATPSYALTVASNENGMVTVDPDLPSYPAGTEVTLTATPNDGYEFAGWAGQVQAGEAEVSTVFDNLDHARDDFITPLPGRNDLKYAQQFVMSGDAILTEVAVEFFRLGTVTGSIGLELWSDNGSDQPGAKITDIGAVEDVGTIPTSDTVYTFPVHISDLDPDGKYWVVRIDSGITSTQTLSDAIAWTFSYSRNGANGSVNSHGFDSEWESFTDIWPELPTLMLQMRVRTHGEPPSEPLELPHENPLTFTIAADTTVAATFAPFADLDTDGDGLTNAEEATLGTDPDNPDTDGDSFSDGYEVAAGTDPNNSDEQPATPTISAITMDPALKTISVSWPSLAGAEYMLESTTDLLTWQLLGTWTGSGSEELTTATIPVPVGDQARYYRLRTSGQWKPEVCVAKVGMIQNFDRNHSGLLQELTRFFPVETLEVVLLENNVNDHGVDAVVDEMEAVVNDMKSQGITRIYMSTFSTEAAPFIEGSAGSLGGVHSDQRHPTVIFAADRQGTASVDNAQNWYRPGIDFKTPNILGPEVLLPDVTDRDPRPQFILATDFSGAVDGQNNAFLDRANAAGYDVVQIDAQWNATTVRFDNVAALGTAIAAAPADSKVGMSFSAESLDGQPALTRWTDMTMQGLADPNIFDPANTNVTYLSMNWVPFHGDFDDPGTIPVDVQFGVVAVTELLADPAGVNSLLVNLGFPGEQLAAIDYDSTNYDNGGHVAATVFAWMATCGERNLDPRHTLDANRQQVFHYVLDEHQPAGKTIFETVKENLRVNPRWAELNPGE